MAGPECLHVVCRSSGVAVVSTACQGDCATDCVASYEGRARAELAWMTIRQEVAAILCDHADGVEWQQCYLLAGEYPSKPPVADERVHSLDVCTGPAEGRFASCGDTPPVRECPSAECLASSHRPSKMDS